MFLEIGLYTLAEICLENLDDFVPNLAQMSDVVIEIFDCFPKLRLANFLHFLRDVIDNFFTGLDLSDCMVDSFDNGDNLGFVIELLT